MSIFVANPSAETFGGTATAVINYRLVASPSAETVGGTAVILGLSTLFAAPSSESIAGIALVVLPEDLFASPSADSIAEGYALLLVWPFASSPTAESVGGSAVLEFVYAPDYDSWNVLALIEKARMNLGDPSGERWSSTRILEVLNDSMVEVALYVQLITETIHFSLTANQALYDMRTLAQAYSTDPREYALPLRMSHLASLPTGKTLPTDLAELGRTITAFRPIAKLVADFTNNQAGRTGSHLWGIDRSTYGTIELIPAPAVTQGYVISDYVAYPTAMSADGDYPDTLQTFLRGVLAAGAASRLLDEGDADDLAHADRLDKEFQSGLRTIASEMNQGKTNAYQSVRPM
jgi:hypothetical protein